MTNKVLKVIFCFTFCLLDTYFFQLGETVGIKFINVYGWKLRDITHHDMENESSVVEKFPDLF